MTTEISIDSMILNHLLAELRDSDPESYEEIVETARAYIKSVGGFEAFAEWGLV